MAADVDCAGGDGNGPAFIDFPVTVLDGADPYRLDDDGDGRGCENTGGGGNGGNGGGGAGDNGGTGAAGGGGTPAADGTGNGGRLAEAGTTSAPLVITATTAVAFGALALLASRRRTA
jgi:hypothetical protein